MKNLKKLYEKNMRDAVYANYGKEDKGVSREKVFYKSMREYMVMKRFLQEMIMRDIIIERIYEDLEDIKIRVYPNLQELVP